MRSILIALVMVVSGCTHTLPEVEIVSKQPTARPGYFRTTYDVRCPGVTNPLEVVRVDRYGSEVVVDEQFRQDQLRKSCRGLGDADQNGPEEAPDE